MYMGVCTSDVNFAVVELIYYYMTLFCVYTYLCCVAISSVFGEGQLQQQ